MLVNPHPQPCAACALKHLASAAVILKEMLGGYNSRAYCLYLLGNLNEAQEQLTAVDPGLAAVIRGLRVRLSPGGLACAPETIRETLPELERIAMAIDHRYRSGRYSSQSTGSTSGSPGGRGCCGRPVDILIPLRADGSANGNWELRYALRSIATHLRGYRHIWILSATRPAGFQHLGWIPTPDEHGRKQMNIHAAIMAAFDRAEVADEVIFWADDNVLLKNLRVGELPVVRRDDALCTFSDAPDARVWHRSLRQTGEALRAVGLPDVNYEAHVPVRFERGRYIALESKFRFYEGVGLCYISLYCNVYPPKETKGTVAMRRVKATVERGTWQPAALHNRLFVGFNDAGFAVLRDELERRLPHRCRYETPLRDELFYPPADQADPAREIGVVIGTCGSARYVELQLAALARHNPGPVLVVDDASGNPKLPALCRQYGAELLALPVPHGHHAGDLQIFAAGLEWAERRSLPLLVKLSRRFVPLKPWKRGLLELAHASNAVTFTSYTTSFGYRFRTECCGLYVPAWSSAVAEIRRAATPQRRMRVEEYLHRVAKRVLNGWESERFREYATQHGGECYALWVDLLGTDRKAPPPDVLWHDAHPPAAYRKALAALRHTAPARNS